jgi:hypothetical protein
MLCAQQDNEVNDRLNVALNAALKQIVPQPLQIFERYESCGSWLPRAASVCNVSRSITENQEHQWKEEGFVIQFPGAAADEYTEYAVARLARKFGQVRRVTVGDRRLAWTCVCVTVVFGRWRCSDGCRTTGATIHRSIRRFCSK